MWILVAEAFGALGLLLFIVWWTLGPTQRREREAFERAGLEAARGSYASKAAAPARSPIGEASSSSSSSSSDRDDAPPD